VYEEGEMQKKERLVQGWDKRVPLYGPPRYLEALKRLAHDEQRPLTAMLRECVRREAQRRGMWQEEEEESS
jgi:hypothetical protein